MEKMDVKTGKKADVIMPKYLAIFLVLFSLCIILYKPFYLEANNDEEYKKQIPNVIVDNVTAFLVEDFINVIEADYEYDELHRSLTMKIGESRYSLIHGIPVLEHNGIYVPSEDIYLMISEDDKLYLPTAFLEEGLGLAVQSDQEYLTFEWLGPVQTASAQTEDFQIDHWDVDMMVEYLSFLQKPILDAQVSTIPNHLPGAPRAYRNGYHEGIDWYGYATGSNINRDTPVYAMAEGVVVRVDHDFEDYPSVLIRNKDLNLTAQLGETPQYIFDRLRGRQVWVQYPNGVMSRFAHLNDIPESIKVGDKVYADTIIGFVGNSGTSGAVNQDDTELHLHQDLLIYGQLFWEPFSLPEVKEVLVRVFE